MTRIDEIRERLDKATPGLWVAETSEATKNDQSQWRIGPERELPVVRARMRGADADLIANAPADLAWCIDYIEELEWVLRGKGLNPAYFTPENLTKN